MPYLLVVTKAYVYRDFLLYAAAANVFKSLEDSATLDACSLKAYDLEALRNRRRWFPLVSQL